jgi:superfamily II DNA/RNA helicase
MSEQEKPISAFERAAEWLPAQLMQWASSSGFFPVALEELLRDRDARLAGPCGMARALTALIAVAQKMRDTPPEERGRAVVLASCQGSEESLARLAAEIASCAGLAAVTSAERRSAASMTAEELAGCDILVTTPAKLEKIYELGLLKPSEVKTVVIDSAEWMAERGETERLAKLCEGLPSARQIIVTALAGEENIANPIIERLSAPVFVRAPDGTEPAAAKELAAVVPEASLDAALLAQGAETPVLFIAATAAAAQRIAALFKNAGLEAKRASAAQSESARDTLLLKFTAGRVERLVAAHGALLGLSPKSVGRIVQAGAPSSPLVYAQHLGLLAEGGSLTTLVSAKELPELDRLLSCAGRSAEVVNSASLEGIPERIGFTVRREKLTVRADFAEKPEAGREESAAEAAPDSGEEDYASEEPAFGDEERPGHRGKKNFRRRRTPFGKKGKYEKHGQEKKEGAEGGKNRFRGKFRGKKKFSRGGEQNKPAENAPAANVQDAAADGAAAPQQSAKPARHQKNDQRRRGSRPQKKNAAERRNRHENRREEWDDDNFGNSIHYQPKRQNLRTLRSDQPIHWQPDDPYHPSSQALSLPQMMPDENAPFGRRPKNGNFNGNRRKQRNFRKRNFQR